MHPEDEMLRTDEKRILLPPVAAGFPEYAAAGRTERSGVWRRRISAVRNRAWAGR